jgi:methyl-accepting chemotaxis protein
MKLKTKLIMTSVISCILIVAASIAGTVWYYNTLKSDQIQKTVSEAVHHFQAAMSAKKEVWQTNALQIAANTEIKTAILEKNRGKADEILKDLGVVFKENTIFRNVNVHLIDKDLTSFYKSWNPDQFGETLDHSKGYPLVKMTGKSFTAMEISSKGIRLKGLFPILHQDRFIGIVNFEGGLNSIKRTLKPYGIDFLYFMDSNDLDTAKEMADKPRLDGWIVNQKDIDPDFFDYAQRTRLRERLKHSDHVMDDAYLVMRGQFDSFDGASAGYYLLGVKTEAVLKTVASLKKMMLLLVGFQTGVFLFLILGLILFIITKVIKPVGDISRAMDESAYQVTSVSSQLATASQQQADGASQQAASIEETSSSMEEMSSMTKQNAQNAGSADGLMRDTIQVMASANDSMNKLTRSMDEISKASEETSKIIKTIDEIAFQTNLLALNAAVEAARAGEAGAGFAVVADEVRNLAMRAAEAAKNTARLIEGTVKKVDGGAKLVSDTSEAFGKVSESAQKVGTLVAEITQASREQSNGIDQVNIAISEMDKVVQQNAANAEESASAAEEMNAQAEQLRDYVSELVRIVTGRMNQDRDAGGHHNVRTISPPRKAGTGSRKQVGGGKKMLAGKTGEVRPDQVIPFDDDQDFKNF